MTVHYQQSGGQFNAAYLIKPIGNIDEVVRSALSILATQKVNAAAASSISGPTDKIPMVGSYIIDFGERVLYSSPNTGMQETRISVEVPKDKPRIRVGINSCIPLPANVLEKMIGIYIDGLSAKGLVPIDSNKQDVLTFLEKGFF